MIVRQNKVDRFTVSTSMDEIRLDSTPQSFIQIAPAEAERVTKLLHIVYNMEGMNTYPPHIQSSPFRIYFESKNKLVLFKKGQANDEGLLFDFPDIDKLIKAIRIGVDMYRDAQVHKEGGSSSRVIGEIHEPAFDAIE